MTKKERVALALAEMNEKTPEQIRAEADQASAESAARLQKWVTWGGAILLLILANFAGFGIGDTGYVTGF